MWWIPSMGVKTTFPTEAARLNVISQRQLHMVRRSTLNHYFTSSQSRELMAALAPRDHVELLVTLFSRVLDLERFTPQDWLPEPDWVAFRQRVGPANCFNPIHPDRFYDLNLRVLDEYSICTMLVVLADEVGENWLEETRNGMRFELPITWVTQLTPAGIVSEVEPNGLITLMFKTPPATASLALRLDLARRHLMLSGPFS